MMMMLSLPHNIFHIKENGLAKKTGEFVPLENKNERAARHKARGTISSQKRTSVLKLHAGPPEEAVLCEEDGECACCHRCSLLHRIIR